MKELFGSYWVGDVYLTQRKTEKMNTVLNKIAELESKIWDMTATMEDEVLYHKLINAVEDFQAKNK